MKNRDTQQNKELAVLRKTRNPAVLIECGFLSNPVERRRALRDSYQDACAQAIVEGILAYKNFR